MRTLLVAYDYAILKHNAGPGHPDLPGRVTAVMSAIKRAPFFAAVKIIPARSATQDETALAHNPKYVAAMRRLCDAGGEFLPQMQAAVGKDTYQAALASAGAGLTLADEIIAGTAKAGFAPTRPPGHHAVWERPGGFCVFNNIAILARYLQTRHNIKRVAIVDFDIHFGNGTAAAFWDDPEVLVVSLHREDHYPADGGGWNDRGRGAGYGFTVNIPLSAKTDDAAYLAAFDRYAAPAIKEFEPQFILASAGFDGHWRDTIGGMKLTNRTFAGIGRRLKKFADATAEGRIISLLEGGYDLRGLQGGVTAYLAQLIQD